MNFAVKLAPYPEYKNSGIPWLGDVPEHWVVAPPKRALQSRSAGLAPIKNTASLEPRDGYVPAFSASGQDVWLPTPMFNGPAIVLSAVGARCGKTFMTDGEWAIVANTHILMVRHNQLKNYWWYVTNNEAWWERAGAAQPFVQVSKTLNRPWAIPPLSEQAAIVRFLDHAGRRISRLIAAKRRLVELLGEMKAAVIHRAVTRGLAPDVPLKPSGIPWLGDVPEHWEVRRGKWLFCNRKNLNTDGQHMNVLSLTLRGVVNNDPENPEGLVPKDYRTYQFFARDDLVFKLIDLENFQTSRVGLAHEDGIMSSAYVRLISIHNGSQRFFFHQYFDLYQRGVFNQLGAGVRATLGSKDLLEIPIVVPPPSEQDAIVEYLDKETADIDAAIARTRREITLLGEYRTRLISDVVTGKLDVREAAARLPKEAGEDDPHEYMETPEENADSPDVAPGS